MYTRMCTGAFIASWRLCLQSQYCWSVIYIIQYNISTLLSILMGHQWGWVVYRRSKWHHDTLAAKLFIPVWSYANETEASKNYHMGRLRSARSNKTEWAKCHSRTHQKLRVDSANMCWGRSARWCVGVLGTSVGWHLFAICCYSPKYGGETWVNCLCVFFSQVCDFHW